MSIEQTHIKIGSHTAQHFLLKNANGMLVELSNWGATLIDVQTPNRAGTVESVTLAHADFDAYEENGPYFGCIVGRVAGRIAHGEFMLNGAEFQLPTNQGAHHLHGGAGAMSHRLWQVVDVNESANEQRVTFSYASPDGENGFPGELRVQVSYVLNHQNQLSIDYEAHTDAPTLCNLTNHAYFNLSGNVARNVSAHSLQVRSSAVCEMDDDLLVTGGEWPTAGTDFDFTQPTALSQILSSDDARVVLARGVDHYFILDDVDENTPQITLQDDASGRRLRVFTDQPCVVLYAHNYAGNEALRHGKIGQNHDALCIETQLLPHHKSENGDHAAALYPEQTYRHHTRFCFDVV